LKREAHDAPWSGVQLSAFFPILWVASGIHAILPDGVLYRADLSKRKLERVRHLIAGPGYFEAGSVIRGIP